MFDLARFLPTGLKHQFVQLPGSILFPNDWNVEVIARVPAGILDLEVVLGMEAMHGRNRR